MTEKRIILILFNRRFDLTDFAESHPGGKQILHLFNGKDATDQFYEAGHLSKHSIMEQLFSLEVKPDNQKQKPRADKIEKFIPNYLEQIKSKMEPKL